MKKEFAFKGFWPFLILLGLFSVSCNKDLKVDVKDVVITSEKVEPQTLSAEISGRYEFPSVLDIDVYVSKHSDLSNAKVYHATVNDHDFSVVIDNLLGDKEYYYCYEFSNGMDKIRLENVRHFKTNPYENAAIETDSVTYVKATTALCGGTVISTEGGGVYKYGVCWTTDQNPTIYHQKIDTIGNITGHFTMKLTGLRPNTVYYTKAYFISDKDYQPVYGQTEKFETKSGIPATSVRKIEKGMVSAVCTYAVYNDNGSPLIEHGICWSKTNENPTLGQCDGHIKGGETMGQSFDVEISPLIAGTDYHVCVYAKNEIGTYYSNVLDFTTYYGTPLFSGFKVTRIRYKSAMLQVALSDDNHFVDVVSKGFLWSTTINNPEIDHCDGFEACGSGSGGYWKIIDCFEEEQEYYVRPYAKYNGSVYHYGEVIHFKTTKKGGLTGAFTINENGDQVCFSQSNLQYQASSNRWCFAEYQWDVIGSGQGNNSQTTDRDLFGWGTSGYNHNGSCYQPWSTSSNNSKYWAYGQFYSNLFNGNGEADWGYNRILIPSLWTDVPENDGWRTLTIAEWHSLVSKCYYDGRFSAGSIVDNDGQTHHGFILLPDDWTLPTGLSFFPKKRDWTTNTYAKNQWDVMEAAGAVFLPAAGLRYKGSQSNEVTDISAVGQKGYYWSSSSQGEGTSNRMRFDLSLENCFVNEKDERHLGHAVRLVKDL